MHGDPQFKSYSTGLAHTELKSRWGVSDVYLPADLDHPVPGGHRLVDVYHWRGAVQALRPRERVGLHRLARRREGDRWCGDGRRGHRRGRGGLGAHQQRKQEGSGGPSRATRGPQHDRSHAVKRLTAGWLRFRRI